MARRPPSSEQDRGTPINRASRIPSQIGIFDQIRFPLNFLVGFAPFVTFTVLARLSISFGLWAAFAFAFALGLPEFLHTRTIRTLDGGGMALFGLSALLSGILTALSNFNTARFVVIIGMLAIALTSFIQRQPFALQYTRAPEGPISMQQGAVITSIWAIAFAIMAAMDGTALYVHGTPERLVLVVNFAMLAGATIFTLRYPVFMRRDSETHPK